VRPVTRQSGFTLLEILVAFTLMAMTFGTIMQIISGSAKNAVKASNNTRIAMLAQSKLDELGLFEKLEEGTNSGDFDDDNSWELVIEPFDVPYEGDISQEFSTVEIMDVTLIITSRQGNQERTTEFKTLRATTPDFTNPR
jgi:general secretion pathway protein I